MKARNESDLDDFQAIITRIDRDGQAFSAGMKPGRCVHRGCVRICMCVRLKVRDSGSRGAGAGAGA